MKTKITLTLAFLFAFASSQITHSQSTISCYVNADSAQIIYEANNPQVFSTQSLSPSQRILSIHLHLVADTGYNYYPDSAGVELALFELNEVFKRSGISFRYCEIDSIENYKYDMFSINSEIPEVKTLYYKAGVINVFVVNNITLSGIPTLVEGHTFFPGGDDIIVIRKQDFMYNGLAHQMGHFFGLYHTYENGFGLELVNGNNCNTTGDLICDTPADKAVDTYMCDPINTYYDSNGEKYHHPIENMMSVVRGCRCVFTIAQLNKMVYNLHNNRSYLK